MYRLFFKRVLDLFIGILALIITLPLFLIVVILLIFVNKGSPFFLQKRPGLNERIFKVIKFKTMTDQKDESGKLLPEYLRITSVGRVVRKLSLDEIPQLINVLKGDMSLVGPRPLLAGYLPLYNSIQKRRHELRPGITGWAQVNGRNSITWEQKFEFDIWYIDHCSFLLDLKICWMTFLKVVKKEGIDAGENLTMKPFNGSPKAEVSGTFPD